MFANGQQWTFNTRFDYQTWLVTSDPVFNGYLRLRDNESARYDCRRTYATIYARITDRHDPNPIKIDIDRSIDGSLIVFTVNPDK